MCNGVVANMANMGRKGLHVAVVPTLLLVMNRGKRKEGNDVEGGGEGGGGSLTSKIRIMFKCRHLQQKPLQARPGKMEQRIGARRTRQRKMTRGKRDTPRKTVVITYTERGVSEWGWRYWDYT